MKAPRSPFIAGEMEGDRLLFWPTREAAEAAAATVAVTLINWAIALLTGIPEMVGLDRIAWAAERPALTAFGMIVAVELGLIAAAWSAATWFPVRKVPNQT